jgi:hypothetical protein
LQKYFGWQTCTRAGQARLPAARRSSDCRGALYRGPDWGGRWDCGSGGCVSLEARHKLLRYQQPGIAM